MRKNGRSSFTSRRLNFQVAHLKGFRSAPKLAPVTREPELSINATPQLLLSRYAQPISFLITLFDLPPPLTHIRILIRITAKLAHFPVFRAGEQRLFCNSRGRKRQWRGLLMPLDGYTHAAPMLLREKARTYCATIMKVRATVVYIRTYTCVYCVIQMYPRVATTIYRSVIILRWGVFTL